ncbi:hypothetical protein RHMOL_Rhmol01G0000400 [Rhododendron molle]|uniref:Uncharacterized protein n=1 Tax=Rhododendron molle TaxID=49168 RepID=A0ACC0PY02_RHOML|nr:hypothetical protein RHMOL_Rhmol01G0000400 [Rhododendron molle]
MRSCFNAGLGGVLGLPCSSSQPESPDLKFSRGGELRWTVNDCPSAASTPRASGSLLFGVASSPTKENHFVFLLRGFAGDLAFGLLYWGRKISLCCFDHFD